MQPWNVEDRGHRHKDTNPISAKVCLGLVKMSWLQTFGQYSVCPNFGRLDGGALVPYFGCVEKQRADFIPLVPVDLTALPLPNPILALSAFSG